MVKLVCLEDVMRRLSEFHSKYPLDSDRYLISEIADAMREITPLQSLRCGDCAYYRPKDFNYMPGSCELDNNYHDPDWFCADAAPNNEFAQAPGEIRQMCMGENDDY